ncbi:DUF3221 domain-containing protein [Bacillus cereus group sp. BfR-BA-01380]|uniref:DUF3221 domain-containing protein n=1 Tax=Bacillus cereus group sp. BfR-BA-01380 TaxID=2920324 RepID=UPI001F569BB5|nr:DUF3221 domain-containing protein [Bacillus cereus group sp. BfR-BA-01380]
MQMKKSIQTVGMIIFFVIIFIMVLMWKTDTSNELKRSTTKTDNNTVSNRVRGYILLKEDTVFFIYEKIIKSDYDRKNLEQRLKWRFPADAILHFNNPNIEKELQTGDKVRIEYSEILESYPAKIQVTKFEKIQDLEMEINI